MSVTSTIYGKINEDGSCSILARVAALTGSGEEYQPGEGNVIQQLDVSSITCKVFDLGSNRVNPAGTEVTPAPTVDVTDAIFDTLQTVGWNLDAYGYNFRVDISPLYPSSPNTYYLFEFKITLVDGGVVWVKANGFTQPVQSS